MRASTRAVRLLLCFYLRPLSTLGEFGILLLARDGLAAQPQPDWIFRSIYESQPMDYQMFCEDGTKLVGQQGFNVTLPT